jgi:hypothetical protein
MSTTSPSSEDELSKPCRSLINFKSRPTRRLSREECLAASAREDNGELRSESEFEDDLLRLRSFFVCVRATVFIIWSYLELTLVVVCREVRMSER